MVLSKVALTGSSGMLGSHIKHLLTSSRIEVVPVSRKSSNHTVEWDLCDWKEDQFFDEIFNGIEAIILAGAMVEPNNNHDIKKMYNSNVRSCLNIGDWAIKRDIPVIYISGAIVYADILKEMQTEKAPRGWHGYGGFYGFSKLLGEDILFRLKEQGLKISILRPTSIYGLGMPSESLVSSFFSKASSGEVIEISNPIEDKVDLIHASDVANAVKLVIKKQKNESF